MPINISFDSTLTQNEADALRALLGALYPSDVMRFDQAEWPVYEQTEAVTGLSDSVSVEDIVAPTLTEGNPNIVIEPKPIEMVGVGDLDSDGKEWDEAIHASTRTKTADGRWKKKRGTGGGAVTAEPVQENEGTEQFTPSTPDTPAVTAVVPTPPAPPVPPPPPAPAADTGLPTFPDSVKICSALGKETYEKLFAEVGIKSVMELKDDAARVRFFEHESVIVARMEKGV